MELALHAETRNLAACEVRGTPPANMDASQPCLGEKKFCQISVIRHCEELKKKDAILLDYVIHEYPYDFGTWALDLPPPFKGIWDAMVSLFDDSSTADVRFIIRHSTRSDDRARQIYAHSKVLSSRCDYFKTLFQSGFSENESGSVDITAFEEHQWEQTSDSDFEDSEEDSNDLADGTSRPESEDGEGLSRTVERSIFSS
ncbi:hypothetical protein OE88DRAFT_1737780 [Heliocybe sulcata]|uniref:BTB domain-containing protein n=1 Tax=Heliocybe sulcata TaxID=5364 RepID=A0A5C3MUN1_9AGAM|nr:hypothetical protein OE88DRAFT_1737780 [Heliocybe sulcata]